MLFRSPAYAGTEHVPLPVTERIASRSLILPLHHELTIDQQDLVVDTLINAVTVAVPSHRAAAV